jgi:hypothetical protein
MMWERRVFYLAEEDGYNKDDQVNHPTADSVSGQGQEEPSAYAEAELPEEERRQLGLLELAYGVLFTPRRTFGIIAQDPQVGRVVLVYLVVQLIILAADVFWGQQELLFLGGVIGLPMLIMVFCLLLLFVILGSFLMHTVAKLLGGKGKGMGVFAVLCLSGLPNVFSAPVDVVAPLIGAAGSALSSMENFGLFIWAIVLQVIGIGKVHQLSGSRLAWTIILSYMALIVIVVVVAWLVLAVFVVTYAGS